MVGNMIKKEKKKWSQMIKTPSKSRPQFFHWVFLRNSTTILQILANNFTLLGATYEFIY